MHKIQELLEDLSPAQIREESALLRAREGDGVLAADVLGVLADYKERGPTSIYASNSTMIDLWHVVVVSRTEAMRPDVEDKTAIPEKPHVLLVLFRNSHSLHLSYASREERDKIYTELQAAYREFRGFYGS